VASSVTVRWLGEKRCSAIIEGPVGKWLIHHALHLYLVSLEVLWQIVATWVGLIGRLILLFLTLLLPQRRGLSLQRATLVSLRCTRHKLRAHHPSLALELNGLVLAHKLTCSVVVTQLPSVLGIVVLHLLRSHFFKIALLTGLVRGSTFKAGLFLLNSLALF